MEKCWFPLNSLTGYSPPEKTFTPEGDEQQSGPLCLGDIIPALVRLRGLDSRINARRPLPTGLTSSSRSGGRLKWTRNEEGGWTLGGSVEPEGTNVLRNFGLSMGIELEMAMKRSCDQFWDIESMETMIIQPSRQDIKAILQDHEVEDEIKNNTFLGLSHWRFFLITGMIIAKGRKRMTSGESKSDNSHAGANFSTSNIAKATLDASTLDKYKSSLESEGVQDFVWAVRVHDISKAWWERSFHHETYRKDAPLGTDANDDRDSSGADVVEGVLHDETLHGDTLGEAELLRTESGGTFVLAANLLD